MYILTSFFLLPLLQAFRLLGKEGRPFEYNLLNRLSKPYSRVSNWFRRLLPTTDLKLELD